MTTIHIQDNGVTAALNELRDKVTHLQPIFNEIGEAIQLKVTDCFENEKSPDGINWAALSPRTLKKRGADAKKLRDTGSMFRSLGHNSNNDHVEITIGQDYAPVHQFGAKIHHAARSQKAYFKVNHKTGASKFAKKSKANFEQWVTMGAHDTIIPARPFFPSQNLPQDWNQDVIDIINRALQI